MLSRVAHTKWMVATAIASRGDPFEIAGVSHVDQFDVPEHPKITSIGSGRTGQGANCGRRLHTLERPGVAALHARTFHGPENSTAEAENFSTIHGTLRVANQTQPADENRWRKKPSRLCIRTTQVRAQWWDQRSRLNTMLAKIARIV